MCSRGEIASDAAKTAPEGIIIREAKYGCGVFAEKYIPANTTIGQYTGRVILSGRPPKGAAYYFGVHSQAVGDDRDFYGINASTSSHRGRHPLTLYLKDPDTGKKIKITPQEQLPSWTRYINSVDPRKNDPTMPNKRSLNVKFFQRGKKIYLRTTRAIRGSPSKPKELLAWYGPDYFESD